MPQGDPIRSDPVHILWHYATGYMPDFLNKRDGAVGWVRWSHRGVHRLDHIEFPDRQKRYVFNKKFEYRVNQSFEAVVRGCADESRFGKTWMTPALIDGLLKLHKLGYAHSWEAWTDGTLAGGVYGIQLGGFICMASMFNIINHAGKAALGRGLVELRDRGFQWIDRGMVPDHAVDYGVEWWPRWRYEAALPAVIRDAHSIGDAYPPGPVPWQVRVSLPLVKTYRGLKRRLLGEKFMDPPTTDAAPPQPADPSVGSAKEPAEGSPRQ